MFEPPSKVEVEGESSFWLAAAAKPIFFLLALLTFAGVGLQTNFRRMSKQGIRPFVVGTLGEILIAVLTLGLVIGANAVWKL